VDSRKVSAQETGRTGVNKFDGEPVNDPGARHPDCLVRCKRHQFTRRDSSARRGYSEQWKTRTVHVRPCVTQRILRRPPSTDSEDIRPSVSDHPHKRRGRHPEPLAEVRRTQHSPAQLGDHIARHEMIIESD
jgi:hypothetical protein